MNLIDTTDCFDDWLNSIKGKTTKDRIKRRIIAAENGNFGDRKPVGSGVIEMRFKRMSIRLYYCQTGESEYVMLIGGHKNTSKEQTQDIETATAIKNQL